MSAAAFAAAATTAPRSSGCRCSSRVPPTTWSAGRPIVRLTAGLAEAQERAEVAENAFADAEAETGGQESDDAGLQERRVNAAEARDAARARVEELRASRARIVEAGMQERRRLERNLHDGAQQRLVALSLTLRLAQGKLHTDPDSSSRRERPSRKRTE